jgi:FkbM family methyltransferase
MSEAFVKKCINNFHRGGIAYDIGANVGDYTKLLSPRFNHVHAFEPTPTTFQWLVHNTKHLLNVTPVNEAISDHSGVCNLYTHSRQSVENTISIKSVEGAEKYDDGKHNIYSTDIYEKVRCVTIDDYVEETKDIPTFIKCDVEGAEDFIFDGAKKTLIENNVFIILELHGAYRSVNPIKLWNFFNNLGYKIFDEKQKKIMEFLEPSHYYIKKWYE